MKDKIDKPYFSLKPLSARTFIFIVVVICFGLVAISLIMDKQNTDYFWDFIKTATAVDIEKIEIQRLDENRRNLGEIITIKDRNAISAFVTALKTAQDYLPNHPSPIYKVRIKIWQNVRNIFNLQRTIEFTCYTMKDAGETLFVGGTLINSGIFSFGNGYVKFTKPNLANWLKKNGVSVSD